MTFQDTQQIFGGERRISLSIFHFCPFNGSSRQAIPVVRDSSKSNTLHSNVGVFPPVVDDDHKLKSAAANLTSAYQSLVQ
jgi:hypothetical protein